MKNNVIKLKQEFKKYDRLFYTYRIRNGGAGTEVGKLISIKITCNKNSFCTIKVQKEGGYFTSNYDFVLKNLKELISTGSFKICDEDGHFDYKLLKPGERVPKGYGNYDSEVW